MNYMTVVADTVPFVSSSPEWEHFRDKNLIE